MKSELDRTSAKSGMKSERALGEEMPSGEKPSLKISSVEVKAREPDPETLDAARAKEMAELTAAEGWAVRTMVLGAVLAIAGVYVGAHIGSGWVPADEGTLSQSALRVMEGQLPHRDFAEIYTGGLSLLHALAFRIFGVSLFSLRICAFLFFLTWIPAVYYVALRFTSAAGAGLITAAAVAWSFPNYPAAMPSWYNLFFATFGAAALLHYLEVRRARWLFVAGVCGGASILIKVTGAYYIAGVLLFLAFLEQSDHEPVKKGNTAVPYRVFSTSALLLFLATVVYEFHSRLGNGEFYHFVLPATALVALILLGERNVRGAATSARFGGLLRLMIPFGCGVLCPLIAFLAPYARSKALGQLFSGITSSVIARSAGMGVMSPAAIDKGVYALALLALVVAAMFRREFQGNIVSATAGLGLVVILVKSTSSGGTVSGVWYSVATLTPLMVLLGVATLFSAASRGGLTKLQQQRVMVLISLAAMCSLVQYPFAAPIYLCFALPLTLLAALAIVATAKKQPGTYVLAAVAGFYLLFGVVVLVPAHIYELTYKVGQMDELHLERAGGLRIEYATNFADLIHVLQQHSPNGLLYAGNDCPELYFLSGLKNVTRDDTGAPAEEVLRALQSDDLKVVVINEATFFPSSRMNPEVRAEVIRKFPQGRQIGFFHVFWRE